MSGKKIYFNHADDHEYSVQMIRWFLKPISVWPLKHNASTSEKIVAWFLVFICILLIFFMVIPCILAIVYQEAETTEARVKDFGPLNFWLIGCVKYVTMLFHADDIRRCVDHMEIDWRSTRTTDERKVMLRSAKHGRFVAGICALFLHSGVTCYNLAALVQTDERILNNDTVIDRYTPYTFCNEIWDVRQSPLFEIVYVAQFLSSVIVNTIMIGSCGLAAVLVMHAHGQLKILISSFRDLIDGNGKSSGKMGQRLTVIVRNHLRVLRFTSTIEDIMHLICLAEVLGSTVTLCLLAYCGVTEWSLNQRENILAYCGIFLSACFNLFVHCFIGEILSQQSQQVGETAYMTEWYRLRGRNAHGVILIILRSNSVIKITAGKFIPLSLSTYTDVLKTALTYFNILRAMTYTHM